MQECRERKGREANRPFLGLGWVGFSHGQTGCAVGWAVGTHCWSDPAGSSPHGPIKKHVASSHSHRSQFTSKQEPAGFTPKIPSSPS